MDIVGILMKGLIIFFCTNEALFISMIFERVKKMTCLNFDGFNEKISITSPFEYFDLLDQLKTIIIQGTLKLIDGNCNT